MIKKLRKPETQNTENQEKVVPFKECSVWTKVYADEEIDDITF